ncbi:Fe(3+) ABC transporter substrate-binding protein [Marinobacterium sp. AK62]|uniref:Fe(3+) ABC transporter substrate-binding protein n=1 Tax=Marinobacterium alkalitolerans TaxID=1542925 RepID=A0ABS3ZB66_9GAMM|nr:Fe(3+) ABC transporter substrate-binding protein [Marinobacterium alkalitolerans]MBP0048953.1 Fe(3+) ABC transporter substrate-binding protein [Marinobacterium alkalitolerans]
MTAKKVLLTGIALTAFAGTAQAADEVNIYSYRQEFLIKPLLEAFTQETGIKANVIFSKKGLLERLEHEGANSPADVILTSDIGPLHDAVERDLVAPIDSDVVDSNVPSHYRSKEDKWVGLTARSRIIYASKDRVEPGEVQTYEDLADPKWKGRICTRSGKHSYNLSLIGSMIEHHGAEEAEQWLSAVKDNLARRPQGNDRAQVKAVKEGQCDLALGNSYYYGKMLTNEKQPEQVEWAKSVNLIFPNQDGRGAHMSISGAALAKHAPHKDAAIKLIEFLTSEQAQRMYAEVNYEFPVRPGIEWSDLLKEHMSDFKADEVNLGDVVKHRAEASRMVDQVGFDN